MTYRRSLVFFPRKTVGRSFFPFPILHSLLDNDSSKTISIKKRISNIIHHSPNSRASQTSRIEIHWWRRGTSLHVCRTIYTHCKMLILIALSPLTSNTYKSTHSTNTQQVSSRECVRFEVHQNRSERSSIHIMKICQSNVRIFPI